MRVAVIGAGSWGTAVACLLGRSTDTSLWVRRPGLAATMATTRSNPEYLRGVPLPDAVEPTADLATALAGAEVVAMAVPSHGFRDVLTEAAPYLAAGTPIVSLTKGIERGSLLRMTEVIRDVVRNADPDRVGVLTGPNLASEVAHGQPTAAVVAVADPDTAARLQRLLMGPTFRVYTNPDGGGVGVGLGRGRPLEEIVGEMKMVAEGVKTTEAVLALADRHGLDMPIARMVGAVLYDGRIPAELVEGL